MVSVISPASLWVRLAALFYDSLLIFGLLVAGTFAVLPFTGGQAVTPDQTWFFLYLFALVVVFYLWFWRRGGATLGMEAWRLQLRREDERPIGFTQGVLRLVVAWLMLGTGLLWCLVDARRRAVHDIVSGTEVVRLPKGRPTA